MFGTLETVELYADITVETTPDLVRATRVPGSVQPRPKAPSQAKGRVLLVEDEPLSQKYCQLLLLGSGYHLDIAANGQMALELVTQYPYQLILMDVGLPDGCGLALAQAIRGGEGHNRAVPIAILSAHLDHVKQQQCLDAGMTAVLSKPVSPSALCNLLLKVIA